MMPILACLISFLLACGLVGLLGQPENTMYDGAGLRPVPTASGPLARTPERPECLSVASFNARRLEACE